MKSIIVAVDRSGGIGKSGRIPWNLPEDLKYFSRVTKHGVCVMGRKTMEDIKSYKKKGSSGPLLKDRDSIVVTSNPDLIIRAEATPMRVLPRMDWISDDRNVFYIGGSRVYDSAINFVDRVYLTLVKQNPVGADRFFPMRLLHDMFREVSVEDAGTHQYKVFDRV